VLWATCSAFWSYTLISQYHHEEVGLDSHHALFSRQSRGWVISQQERLLSLRPGARFLDKQSQYPFLLLRVSLFQGRITASLRFFAFSIPNTLSRTYERSRHGG